MQNRPSANDCVAVNSANNCRVINKPLTKKNTVTPKPPGTTLPNPA